MKRSHQKRCSAVSPDSPKGQAVIEMIFSMLMFMLLVTAITSLGLYLYVQHSAISTAREGARVAASSMATSGGGVDTTAVKTYTETLFKETTGLTLHDWEITVTAPSGGAAYGDRSVTVAISYPYINLLPLKDFLNVLTQQSYELDTFWIHAKATMRYEG